MFFFQFYSSTLSYLAFSFMIFSAFHSKRLSQSHILTHMLVELTRIESGFFIFFLIDFFQFCLSSFSLFKS